MSKKIRLGIIIALVLGVFFVISPAIADGGNEGGQIGGGGQSGCGLEGWTLDTCYGAQWRWYEWPGDAESVTIRGKSGAYAAGGVISGCAVAGGYWRYAMVAYDTGTYKDGTNYYSGDQVGLIGMSGNESRTYDSEYWDGGMNYIGNMTEDFAIVEAAYSKAQERWPETFTLGFDEDSNLSWFCAEDPEGATFFSSSKVQVNGSTVAETGIVKEQTKVESSDKYVKTSETTIKFTHDIFADKEKEDISWKVDKQFKKNGGYISLTGGTGGSTNGTANITTAFSGHTEAKYISTTSPQYDDEYKKNLSLAATYKLCESMAVDDTSSYLSKVCANIKVPYNFNNTASIDLGNVKIFAGEATNISIDGEVDTGTRTNNTTGGTYATRVDDAKIKVVSYLSNIDESGTDATEAAGNNICASMGKSSCDEVISKTGLTLNADNDLNGDNQELSSLVGDNKTVNVYDAPAGTFYCVAVAVYPASSGIDTMMAKTGSNTWYISKPSCKRIAKKPSLQVWGSGLYANGKIAVSNAVKHVVKGVLNDYDATNKKNVVFGSWVEQNVIANGLVSIASGAADGLAGATNRTKSSLNGSYSDSSSDQICILSPLTMPNNKCGAMNPGGTSGSMNMPDDKDAFVARFTENDSSGNYELYTSVCSLNNTPSFGEKNTQVYKCDDDFTIDGDIEVLNATYSSLIDVPKLIIYSKKSIKIACNVARIDAVLIAEDSVDTCYSNDDVNSQARSKQLKINGTVITNKLFAKRTYGAATGVNSGEPAEIIDYDTSLYLWGSPMADTSSSGKLEEVYRSELAPRY